ncbi:MAG: hypothetical protein IID38_05750 [Planctomycetes bacterium]|nr:hypothetical protein [Planctomycetota bacterium]
MSINSKDSFRCFFTREELIESPRSLLNARIVRCDLFEKTIDGEVIRFVIQSLMLSDGRVIPMVEHPDHLPLMDEVLRALESGNG